MTAEFLLSIDNVLHKIKIAMILDKCAGLQLFAPDEGLSQLVINRGNIMTFLVLIVALIVCPQFEIGWIEKA